jgi:tellurite resistance protein TehA-like permease
MLWAVGSAVGLLLMTWLILALARPITARWEQEQLPPVTADE